MLQQQRDDPHFAQGIKDSRTVRSGSNSKQHSRSVSQTPEDRNHQNQQGQEQQQNDSGGDGTKTYHHVVCDKFIPTWGLPRVCNRCKGQRRDHPDAASVAAASLKNRSLTLMQKRNLINNGNSNATTAASTATRKPASAFQTNGRIHAKTHTDPMENILQQQTHHLNINNISSSSVNNNDNNINNTSSVIAVTPQQQIYSTRMNLSNASSTANNHEGNHDNISTAAKNENDHDERNKSGVKADTVTSNSTTTTRSSSLGSTHDEGNHVINRDVKETNSNSREADDDHQELAEAAKKSSTSVPSTASLMMLSGGSGGGVLGNFARVSTALQEGQEDEDAARNHNREGGGKVSKNESVMSDSSPEQYELDEDVVLSENEEEQEKQRVKEKNLAHYAEF